MMQSSQASDPTGPDRSAADVGGDDPQVVPVDGSSSSDADGGLTHLDAAGHVHMVDVAGKDVTHRIAQARARLLMAPDTARRLMDGKLPKGDALAVARVAGIQAAKRTSELIPLCHQIALTSVTVDIEVDAATGQVDLTAQVETDHRTGVEMEALTAVSIAALNLYDLTKAVQRDVVIADIRLTRKSGGQSGDFIAR